MGNGSSRPSWPRSFATSSGVAYGPAMTLAGSPGARWIKTKAIVATITMTGITARTRRTR